MKDLVQCRKLEAKFRQLAVSDPARRFLWLAEAEKWERGAEAEIASHFEARNAVRTTVAIERITTQARARSCGLRSHCAPIHNGGGNSTRCSHHRTRAVRSPQRSRLECLAS